MKKYMKLFVFLFITFISSTPSFSATWDGGGSGNLASTPANWTGNVIPPYNVNIIFDNTSSKSCTWDLNQTYTSFTIGSGYTGAVTINSTLILASNYSSAGGIPVSGYPNWQERAVLVVTNAVREAPQAYRATYTSFTNILLPANYQAVAPLYWNVHLNQSARFYAVDMATTPCWNSDHSSCDGTPWATRISSYYPSAMYLGENIAYWAASPKSVVELWICDSTANCATDMSAGDGHRQNIMSANYKELGSGYYSSYWVQDFGATTSPIFQPPIVSGAHMAISGQLNFWLNYYDTVAAPQAVRLVINGSSYNMTLAIGSAQSGLYTATAGADSVCESYHFEAVDSSGRAWRYPGTGEFRTYGINSCIEDYTSSAP